jgi:hypothetical protein
MHLSVPLTPNLNSSSSNIATTSSTSPPHTLPTNNTSSRSRSLSSSLSRPNCPHWLLPSTKLTLIPIRPPPDRHRHTTMVVSLLFPLPSDTTHENPRPPHTTTPSIIPGPSRQTPVLGLGLVHLLLPSHHQLMGVLHALPDRNAAALAPPPLRGMAHTHTQFSSPLIVSPPLPSLYPHSLYTRLVHGTKSSLSQLPTALARALLAVSALRVQAGLARKTLEQIRLKMQPLNRL